ncbi:MAG: YkgJ family cysteine cluster protein [Treponema sp.]|nr:YkgJ family cysteine cluster protein [Treponema sp.]
MDNVPFYASGLDFTCKRCSACCRFDSGFVYLSEKDLAGLVSALKMERSGFIKTYCKWVSDWNGNNVLSLKEKNNKDCILWEDGCIVYKARPLQCVTFPFWESIVASSKAWAMAASGCPGINTGELHTKNEIEANIKQRSSEPIISETLNETGNI